MLNLSQTQDKSVFYCSHEELRQELEEEAGGVAKSASTTNLTETDSGLGVSCKELSRSLDCLEAVSNTGEERRKSQTLPNFPLSSNLSSGEIKKLSLSTAFGSKRITLGRKLSSLINLPTDR